MGVLAYVADPITATAGVPAGQSFSLGGKTYYSSNISTPVGGHGKIDFNRAAPTATFGWGNLLPRSGRHWAIPFEMGVAFQGSPKATLALTGNACDAPGVNCRSVTDPTIQNQIISEQTKINNSMSFFKVYPIISVGFGYNF